MALDRLTLGWLTPCRGQNYRQQNGQNGSQKNRVQQCGNGNYRGNNGYRRQNRGQNRNEHTVRFVTQNAPMQQQLGFQQQQPQQEQVVQIPFY